MNPQYSQDSMARHLASLNQVNASFDSQERVLIFCASRAIDWFNDWVWTYDPRRQPSTIPMELFPRQEELLAWLEVREARREDGLVSKSRDMGLTWLCAGFLVHHWLFVPGFKGSVGSRKEDLVDRVGDPDSIFEKMRMLLRRLPRWMIPPGFDWKRHDNFLKLINPANGATITGEAGDNIGRGGRSSIYFLDEFAFVERAERVEAALSANTDCRIYVSTSNGPATLFAKKRRSGNINVFEMDWHEDPRKNAWSIVRDVDGVEIECGDGGSKPSENIAPGCRLIYPWYESEKRRIANPVIIAQEIDRDDSASLEGVAIPARWVNAAVELRRRMSLPRSENVVAGLDVADGGDCSNILVIRRGCVIEQIHERKEGGTTDTANWALQTALAAGCKQLNFDAPGVGAGVAGAYAARSRTMPLGLVTKAVNTGSTPTEARWPDGRTSKEWFVNLKAELWWRVRRRFEKTFEFIEDGIKHPLDELVSIPSDGELIMQLSNVLYHTTEAGKIQIETKQQLAQRGVKSPDRADALMLAFAPRVRPRRALAGGQRKDVAEYTAR